MTVINATMAGTIWKVLVQEGQPVSVGEQVVILESMKMEIPIETESSDIVKKCTYQKGILSMSMML